MLEVNVNKVYFIKFLNTSLRLVDIPMKTFLMRLNDFGMIGLNQNTTDTST